MRKRSEEILVKRYETYGRRTSVVYLRRSMMESGVPYKCAGADCTLTGAWLGKPLRLQVEHKNGDWLDNRLENLEFLCPNCHSQTATWGKDKGETSIIGRHRRSKPKVPKPWAARPSKITWPTDEELQNLLWAQPATHVAATLGLSSTAIKKRCHLRNVPTPPRGYWAKLKAAESKS